MTKSELIEALANKQPHLTRKDVRLAVDCMIKHMSQTLTANDRIEIRGFGCFSLHHRPSRLGRNPKTGEPINLPAKYSLYFKPGKELRQRIDLLRATCPIKKKS
jgi:integration host factor subunit beta